ncbi:MAG: ATP-binding protein [Actinomycetota bacterium]|nr:ATP-binding protein [Actinomycetota bacterium]
MAQAYRSDDLETTLLWIVTGYRVFAAVWLSILGLVVLSSDTTPVGNPPVVAATIGLVVTWAATATAAAILRPRAASTWWFVAIDLTVSAWTVAAGTVAITIQFAGGYPLAGAFGAIYAFGVAGGAVGAATLTATGLFPLLNNESQSFSQDVANAIAFLFSVGAAIGVASALRRSDHRRVEAEEALATERTERARAEEHAEVAAHLHDSVLQTLALIQRDPASTSDIRGLARHQERELRAWLFPGPNPAGIPSGGFREALVDVCSEIEDMGGVQVEVVVVGNTNASVDPIVRAAREAILNARKHAEVDLVSVYGEADAKEVQVFVKDRGKGFEPTIVDDSRHGIGESIVGRMERHGGSVEIISAIGSGTEVRLRLPLGDS